MMDLIIAIHRVPDNFTSPAERGWRTLLNYAKPAGIRYLPLSATGTLQSLGDDPKRLAGRTFIQHVEEAGDHTFGFRHVDLHAFGVRTTHKHSGARGADSRTCVWERSGAFCAAS